MEPVSIIRLEDIGGDVLYEARIYYDPANRLGVRIRNQYMLDRLAVTSLRLPLGKLLVVQTEGFLGRPAAEKIIDHALPPGSFWPVDDEVFADGTRISHPPLLHVPSVHWARVETEPNVRISPNIPREKCTECQGTKEYTSPITGRKSPCKTCVSN